MMRPGITVLSLLAIIILVIGVVLMAMAFNYWVALPLIVVGAVILISRAAQRRGGPDIAE